MMKRHSSWISTLLASVLILSSCSAVAADSPGERISRWIGPDSLPPSIHDGEQPRQARELFDGARVANLRCTSSEGGGIEWTFGIEFAGSLPVFGAAAIETEAGGLIAGFFQIEEQHVTTTLTSNNLESDQLGINPEVFTDLVDQAGACSIHLLGFQESDTTSAVNNVVWSRDWSST